MKILIAPDKFKDALDAAAVAAALAAGVHAARPDVDVSCCPLGDGGEGTGRLLAEVLQADERTARVHDPLGRPRTAHWWLHEDDRTAIIESAEASGLALLTDSERDAMQATSFGTGELLNAAVAAGCRRVTLCVGGSAMVDGGAACLQALGWQLLDGAGHTITAPVSGGRLAEVAGLRPPTNLIPAHIEILCDVDNPLLGSSGAAPVFAPQKGATPEQVRELSENLRHWSNLLQKATGREVATPPGAGAAGGLPAGLAAALDARLLPGFDTVAKQVDLQKRLLGCKLCFTGEGRIDAQTTGGKVVAGVARMARNLSVPTVAFVGSVDPGAGHTAQELAESLGLAEIVVITPPATPLAAALAETADNLQRSTAHYVSTHC